MATNPKKVSLLVFFMWMSAGSQKSGSEGWLHDCQKVQIESKEEKENSPESYDKGALFTDGRFFTSRTYSILEVEEVCEI